MKTVNVKVRRLNSVREKAIGLIGKKTAEATLFKTRFGIHTIGLRFPIDVLILDNKNKIIYSKSSLKPNRIFIWNPRYKNVLELPDGFVAKKNLEAGDILTFDISKS